VSTPVTWDEVDTGVSPRDFTVANFGERIKAAGDPWAALRKSKGLQLDALKRSHALRR
jgi:DNA primase